MNEADRVRRQCQALAGQLNRGRGNPRSIYMEMAPLLGEVQGLVSQVRREQGETPDVAAADEALSRFKSAMRQVGLDIRLASSDASRMGLQSAIECVLEALDQAEKASTQ